MYCSYILVPIQRKCDMYWPKDDNPVTYGSFEVHLEKELVLANYTVRTMKVKHLKVRIADILVILSLRTVFCIMLNVTNIVLTLMVALGHFGQGKHSKFSSKGYSG